MTNIKPLLFKIMELSTNKFYDDNKSEFVVVELTDK
jgi:hypothetical protein